MTGSGDGDSEPDTPDAPSSGAETDPEPHPQAADPGPFEAFVESEDPVVVTVREVLTSVAIVAVVGLVLFTASGIWPPLVAVESGSMEPHMFKGDLVFVVEDGRYAPEEARSGVVTFEDGTETGYWSFGDHGNVVVYRPDGREVTPIIHRAHFYVEEGENWVARANPEYTGGATCRQVRTCPAPHDGFITKGDNNAVYDQVARRSTVVRPEWVRGVAKVRVPWLGCIRLQLSGNSCLA